MIIPLWKWKEDRWNCSNYCGITLLSIPGKSGFTPCKSTVDHIIVLRVTVECRHKFGHELLGAYSNLKKAFDSVHRKSQWEILRLRSILLWLIGFITSLYTGSESAVKHGGGLWNFFPVNSGVRQVCVLIPTLFNTCMDWILGRAKGRESIQLTYACDEDVEVSESFTCLDSVVHVYRLSDQEVSKQTADPSQPISMCSTVIIIKLS
ncbi:uncharacterized protein LOC119579619 [Penaeus monodon]|uniref:uncharacterized protein LOC119579619 n=1 Tax=Penaeus monodon TaxID=6687 RepID=UPI0018A72486|nr:uncharacterized protein LOC119579619 [Penaeus monodon]